MSDLGFIEALDGGTLVTASLDSTLKVLDSERLQAMHGACLIRKADNRTLSCSLPNMGSIAKRLRSQYGSFPIRYGCRQSARSPPTPKRSTPLPRLSAAG